MLAYSTGSVAPDDKFKNPANALGAPNWDQVNFGKGFVSLGCGGKITLAFPEGRGMDVHSVKVVEIGSAVEDTRVEIQTASGWISIGKVRGRVDTQALPSPQPVLAVRLTDLESTCGKPTPGADIDAVALIGR